MQEYIGNQTTYVVLQERSESEAGELLRLPVKFNNYDGSQVTVYDLDSASHFEVKEDAISLANLHNQISVLLKQDLNYIVVENKIERAIVEAE